MNGTHHFALRIERHFADARHFSEQAALFDAVFLRYLQKCNLGGVSCRLHSAAQLEACLRLFANGLPAFDLPAFDLLANGCVVAQRHSLQKQTMRLSVSIYLRNIAFNSIRSEGRDRHLVPRQRARLIRTDHGHRPQRFYRRQPAHNGIFLAHNLHADGKDDGDDRR